MIRLHVRVPGLASDEYLCTATPDAPSDEDARWSVACYRRPGHDGPHIGADPAGSLDSEVRW